MLYTFGGTLQGASVDTKVAKLLAPLYPRAVTLTDHQGIPHYTMANMATVCSRTMPKS